jgi:hypothetical protein
MKKIILSLTVVLAFALTSDAQTRKGTVLLGAGSNLTETAWSDLAITPKVGYFVQDGVAIGALINFDTHNSTSDAVELNSSLAELGVFARYYVSNNLFTEIQLSSMNSSSEHYDDITIAGVQATDPVTNLPMYDPSGDPIWIVAPSTGKAVLEVSDKTMNFALGLGYTIVWREHFAVEPFVNLVFMNGERKSYDEVNNIVTSEDLKGTDFNLGVNFSLFF